MEGGYVSGKHRIVALVVVTLSALVALPGTFTPAGAVPGSATGSLNCVAHAPFIGDQSVTQSYTINTDAPVTVLPGATFSVTLQTPADTIAASQSGGTVASVQN